ncbi:MAG: pyruvate, phosphate dikinase, partial [Candidatus Omnitrophica bacterium]|nr:pyruvate, phosphate dikinase [Candidatus Omnitrophota bacterium]
LPASPGAASGKVVFSADEAEDRANKGQKVILVRMETSPEDIHGMVTAEGILTARGGVTSHAAVVARGMGKCCVAGCEAIKVNYKEEQFAVGSKIVKKGEDISIDGTSGEVMKGRVPTVDSEITQVIKGTLPANKSAVYKIYNQLMQWAQEFKRLGVRANADTPGDAKVARAFGATGIGLCRTEHMFFGEERLPEVRKMILADTELERKQALEKLLPFQRQDFKGILKVMDGLPVIIRLLDPPLHEFLPKHEELSIKLAKLKDSGGDKNEIAGLEKILAKVTALHESNPMLGHRGCRLGITFPEINRMQARAIFEAACELIKEGHRPIPEVMIPVVSHVNEVRLAKKDIQAVAEEVMKENNVQMEYMVGTMIELPRAALTADEIAEEAEFFSYGTNDLTQTTFGFSRDDIEGKFLPVYIDKKILADNPFAVLDRPGVGQLLRIGIEKGRSVRPEMEVGICGEHGGEPSSVEFCHSLKMDYVSCSPYRVPIAMLSAAQAAIKYS